MWDVLVRTPRGSNNPRKFSMLLATFFVALLGYLFITTPSVSALDASWEGDNILYEGQTYKPVPDGDARPNDLKDSSALYSYTDTSQTPGLIYYIYFDKGIPEPKDEKEATYVRYTLNPPNRFVNAEGKKTITLAPAVTGLPADPGEAPPTQATSCAVDNVGWLVCGVGGFIAEGIDYIYGIVSAFLKVQPLTSDGTSSLYNLWDVMRNIANVAFVIGFLVVIYSYLVGGGFNGYQIRKILPRIAIAAILINISFWICSVAVDISNILGISLQDLLINIRENSVAVSENRSVSWGEMTAYILSGGTIGTIGLLVATGGSAASLAFLLLGVLLVVVFALFVALVILAARQAVLIILIVISPLAFAAFILPNTEKWFDRWRGIFTTLLLLFPVFSLLFGGSQLAGAVIIQNAPDGGAGLAIMLFGMAVQLVPLVITPLLIQFSGGLIGRIAGIVNSSEKGLLDRSKNWTKDRQELHRQKNLAQPNTGKNNFNLARRGAQRMYAKDVARKKRLEAYQKDAEDIAHNREFKTGPIARTKFGQYAGMENSSYSNWDQRYRAADIRHQKTEAHHKAEFDKKFDTSSDAFDSRLYMDRTDTYKYAQASRRSDARFETDRTELEAGEAEVVLNKIQNVDTREAIRASLGGLSTKLQDLNREISVETDRKGLAEKQIQGQLAGELKDNIIQINGQNIREYAAGIDKNGSTKVYARAMAERTKQHIENIDAVSSIYSNEGYELPELFRVIESGQMRPDKNGNPVKASDIQIHSAIKDVFTVKGNNWAAQKLLDYTATQGMKYDDVKGGFVDINGTLLSEEDAGNRRDFQQIVKEYAGKSPLKVDYLSATERTKLETGTFMASAPGEMKSESMILADAKVGKFDQTRILNADVDVLQRMVQVFREPGNRAAIGETGRKNLLDQITKLQSNPQINASIKDRERGVMNALASYLDDSDGRPATEKEREFWYVLDENGNKVRASQSTAGAQREVITVQAPTEYTYNRPFDGDVSGYGPAQP